MAGTAKRKKSGKAAAIEILRQSGKAMPVKEVVAAALADPPPAVEAVEQVERLAAPEARHDRQRPGWNSVHNSSITVTTPVPTDVAPSAYNEDDPPGDLPASPLAPRPQATSFRWAA